MARRRMFSLDVVDTDAFLDLPCSSQALYFQLGMRADDEGFVASPRRVATLINASTDDLKLLASKGFLIPFDSGVCVIRDWKKNNYLQNDRCTKTVFVEEKQQLQLTANRAYQLMDTGCIQNVSNLYTQNRLEQISSDLYVPADKPQTPAPKVEETRQGKKRTQFVPPTVEEVQAYCSERGNGVDANAFVDYYTAIGWKVGRNKMRDWKASVRYWERNRVNSTPAKSKPAQKSTTPQRTYSLDDMVEYPPGSGKYIPADRVPKEGNNAV